MFSNLRGSAEDSHVIVPFAALAELAESGAEQDVEFAQERALAW
jgi:hypothetical protein